MIVTHYLAGLPNLTSPALLVRPVQGGMERNLYNVYAENVQNIGTIEVDEKNIHEFLPEARNTEEGMGVVPTVVEPGTGAKGA